MLTTIARFQINLFCSREEIDNLFRAHYTNPEITETSLILLHQEAVHGIIFHSSMIRMILRYGVRSSSALHKSASIINGTENVTIPFFEWFSREDMNISNDNKGEIGIETENGNSLFGQIIGECTQLL